MTNFKAQISNQIQDPNFKNWSLSYLDQDLRKFSFTPGVSFAQHRIVTPGVFPICVSLLGIHLVLGFWNLSLSQYV